MKGKIVTGLILLVLIGVSAYIRIYLPYDQIITGDWVNFGSADSYGLMRYVDSAIYNFPHFTHYDPYLPDSGTRFPYPFIFSHWLLALIIRVIGLGGIPGQRTIDIISAYYPAILGILTIIPVYFLGKNLFNKWAGLLAAAMMSVLPGFFLSRSLLGNTDYHVAEVLFSTAAVMFLVLALKRSTYYAIPSGIFLGIYLITWPGGIFFAFIMVCCIAALMMINHFSREGSSRLYKISSIIFAEALLISLMVPIASYIPISLLAACIFLAIAYYLSRYMLKAKKGGLLFPLYLGAIVVLILVIAGSVIWWIRPNVYITVQKGVFSVFSLAPTGTSSEARSLFAADLGYHTLAAWTSFATSFFLLPHWPIPGFALISLAVVLGKTIKSRFKDKYFVLFLIWSLAIILVTILHRRYAYYLAVNIALLSGYLFYLLYLLLNKVPELVGKNSYLFRAIATLIFILILFAGYAPNINLATELASQPPYIPSKNWQSALAWLKTSTPEPFGNDDVYYQLFPDKTKLPVPSYVIISWWDYGYWIGRAAHRVSYIDPSNSSPVRLEEVAKLLLATENDVSDSMSQLNARYIVVDKAMASGMLLAIVQWAKEDATTRSLVLRLYNGYNVVGFKNVYDNGSVKIFEYIK